MAKKTITKINKALIAKVIDCIFEGKSDAEIAEEVEISLFPQLASIKRRKSFLDEITQKTEDYRRQTQIILVRYQPIAAMKLVSLMQSEKEEGQRKACIDILEANIFSLTKKAEVSEYTRLSALGLDDETASQILKVLAERGRKSEHQASQN